MQTHPINLQTASNQNSGSKPERNWCVQTYQIPRTTARTASALHNAG